LRQRRLGRGGMEGGIGGREEEGVRSPC